MKIYQISEAEYEAIESMSRVNQYKDVDKRLQVLLLRYEGKTDREIGEKLGYHRKRVSQLCSEYKQVGLEEYARRKYGGNHRNLSIEEEAAFLSKFKEAAETGQVPTVSEIAAAYDEETGKERVTNNTVYELLHRHGWRKLIPQTAHPGKASEEEIESSKKLKNSWTI